MSRRITSWALAALALAPAGLLAQAQTTGRIVGEVRDQAGTPLAGVEVTATAIALDLERQTTTDAQGQFALPLLPVGDYTVSAVLEGFQPRVAELRVGVGRSVPVNFELAPGEAVAETIEVLGEAAVLETTTLGQNVTYDSQVEKLPIFDRDPQVVAGLLSGSVNPGPNAGQLVIAGAPAFDTSVLVDGAEVSDPYFGSAPDLWLEDALEEVQVMTSGISARYGRFQGGVINAITKSGGNEFEGSLRAELSKESWNSQTPYGESQSDDLQKVYQGTLGGYLVKDRLWFFAGARLVPETGIADTTLTTGEGFETTLDTHRYQLKLRGALNSSHVAELSWFEYEAEASNYDGLGAGELAAATGQRSDPRETWALAYQGVLSGSSFLEAQYTKKDVAIVSGATDPTRSPLIDYFNLTVYNNHWWDARDKDLRNNETAAVSYSTAFSGDRTSHLVEGGVQYVVSEIGGENRQSVTGLNYIGYDPSLFVAGVEGGQVLFNATPGVDARWKALSAQGKTETKNLALYLQDAWELASRWRIDAGLRWERYEGEGPVPQFNLDADDLAPRLGLTFSVRPELQVQATYGKYISRFNDNLSGAVTGVGSGPLVEQVYIGPALFGVPGSALAALLEEEENWGQITGYTDPTLPITVLDDDTKVPYTEETTLSLRGGLPGNRGSFTLAYVHRDYEELLDDFAGRVCDYGFSFGRPCPEGNTTPIVADGEVLGATDTIVWANSDRAFRKYDGVTASVDWRPVPELLVGGNYTYSRTRANYEGEARNQPASGSPIGDYEAGVDVSRMAPGGYADDDVRHRLNVYSTYDLPLGRAGGLNLGGYLYYRSGAAWSKIATAFSQPVEGYLGQPPTYRYYFGERGSERFDDWWGLDLAVRYDFPAVWKLEPWVKLGVTNVLNNDAVIQHQTTGRADDPSAPSAWIPSGTCGLGDEPSTTCSRFGRIRNQDDYQDPRQYLLSVGLRF